MTPAQQAALEALAGRALTAAELSALEAPLLAQDTAAIAAALPAVPVIGEVSRDWFATWAAGNGMRAKIEDSAANPDDPLRSIALTLVDVLRSPSSGISFAYEHNRTMLAEWVAAGHCSQPEADRLLALATRYVPIDEMSVRQAMWSINGEWLQ